jgi:hypothetical protein
LIPNFSVGFGFGKSAPGAHGSCFAFPFAPKESNSRAKGDMLSKPLK